MMTAPSPELFAQPLSHVLNILDSNLNIDELDNINITDISDDSRNIENGGLFIARKGSLEHGDRYVIDAIGNGAVAILHQLDIVNTKHKKASYINWEKQQAHNTRSIVPEIYIMFEDKDLGKLAADFYNNPSDKVSITGITGTNGKTSCAFLLAYLISKKQKCGFIGTIGIGELDSLKETMNTTPGAIENQKIIAEMVATGIEHIVMEVSSHALAQNRIAGISIDYAIFTNLTHDHLDFHLTFENYGFAKLELFKLDKLKYAAINLDDQFSFKIKKSVSNKLNIISYGIDNKDADVSAVINEVSLNATDVSIQYQNQSFKVILPVIGDFNISNILAVSAILLTQGHSLDQLQELLQDIPTVMGRMQCLGGDDSTPLVVVDYAHTPDALSKVLQTLRGYSQKNLICLFGCGGDRDKTKRASMGEIASTLADIVIITNDNPRFENPNEIAKTILSGVSNRNKSKINIVLDRKQAIQDVIRNATKHDVILIAGKGHEKYQDFGARKIHFDDVEISLNVLNKLGMK